MIVRKILIFLGAGCILAATYLLMVNPPAPSQPAPQEVAVAKTSVLVAAKPVSAGTPLQASDVIWKEVGPADMRAGNLVQGQTNESEYLNTVARRDFKEGEAFVITDLLRLGDRKALAAALKPGTRAISVSVDAAQSSSGLILPGDHVDVILIQMLGDNAADARRKAVAETILQNVRVIAIDQTVGSKLRSPADNPLPGEQKMPKTVTLELTERQAEKVFVALQLGTLHLSVRPIEAVAQEAAPSQEAAKPTWSYEVSPALRDFIQTKPAQPAAPSNSSIENSIRRPPAS